MKFSGVPKMANFWPHLAGALALCLIAANVAADDEPYTPYKPYVYASPPPPVYYHHMNPPYSYKSPPPPSPSPPPPYY